MLMSYLQAIIALFAIVDPIGNIPIFLNATERLPAGQRQKAFNTAVGVGAAILLIFAFAGKAILAYVFRIELADIQIAGGILLLLTAINSLVFVTGRKSFSSVKVSAIDIGCVPLACPYLAGPGAMVTCLSMLQKSGPGHVIAAVAVVFAILWVVMRFVDPIHRVLGQLVSTAINKIMLVFIAAIGVNMIMTGIQTYFTAPK